MRNDNGTVVDYFTLPSSPPAPVVSAYDNYVRLCEEHGEACVAYTDAVNAVELGRRDDVRELASAFEAGRSDATLEGKFEERARAALADAQIRRAALEEAVDKAGDTLMDAIEAVQSEWLVELAEAAVSAEKTFTRAIDEAGDAAETLANARGTIEWLSRFEARKMRTGGAPPGTQRVMAWNGIATELQVPLPGTAARMFTEMVPARELLASMRQAVKP
jgi:hypothetical protein